MKRIILSAVAALAVLIPAKSAEAQYASCRNSYGDIYTVGMNYEYGAYEPTLVSDSTETRMIPARIESNGYYYDISKGYLSDVPTYVRENDLVYLIGIQMEPDCTEQVIVYHPASGGGGLLPGEIVSAPLNY